MAYATACGRIGFAPGDGDGTGMAPSGLSYAGVRPIYMLDDAIPPLRPTVMGTPTSFTITPALPALQGER